MGKKSTEDLELPVAGWLRGLSLDQMQAAEDLGSTLNFELGGIQDCLVRLGLRPVIKKRQIHRIVQLSRGQKLAFLFFLFEEYYKSSGPCGSYTDNGQILLSAIAYLDLPATFRALDKILPLSKGRVSSSNTSQDLQKKNFNRLSNPTPNPSMVAGVAQNDIEDKVSKLDLGATFRALDRVLSKQATQSTSRRSCQKCKRAKPYFQKQPRPRSTREITNFTANPPLFGVQIPNEVGDEKEDDDRWFADYQFHPIQRTVKAFINHELCHLFDRIDEAPTDLEQDPKDLCEFHEETRSQERQAFIVGQRQRYLEMIDVEGKKKRLTRERIIHHLNRDVDEYLRKFGVQGWSPGVPTSRSPKCVACNELVDVTLETPPQVLLLEGEWGRLYDRSGPLMRLVGGDDVQENFPKKEILKKKKPEYFTAPTNHSPYIFDYEHIFEKGSKEPLDIKETYRSFLIKELDEETNGSVLRTIRRSHIDEAVSRCVRRIFEKSLLAAPCMNSPSKPKERLVYNCQQIDPDDEEFLDQMLGDAFQILKKDKKLVLASLPDGHRVPELREWIRRRYGKRYGPQTELEEERLKYKTLKLAEMEKELIPLRAYIDPRITGENPLPFAQYDEIMEVAKKCKKLYREGVLQIVLDRTRLIWNTQHNLRMYSSSGLRRTFFTYLPSSARNTDPTISNYLVKKNGIL